MADDYAYQGMEDASSSVSDYNSLKFFSDQILNRISTATLVQIKKVSNNPGDLQAVGRVDVLPLVNQIDGSGKPTPHQTVYNLSYFRYQGGSNAVILDPQVNDIGLAVFCDRDISTVKSTQQQSNPGSHRKFSKSDGIYIGLCLADKPTQYITFTNNGITIADKNGNKIDMGPDGITITDKNGNIIKMESSGVDVTAPLLTNTNDIVAGQGGADKVSLQSHVHSGVMRGGADTDPPVAES